MYLYAIRRSESDIDSTPHTIIHLVTNKHKRARYCTHIRKNTHTHIHAHAHTLQVVGTLFEIHRKNV